MKMKDVKLKYDHYTTDGGMKKIQYKKMHA